jgi:predicted O-methyltransferase YrrM
MMAQLKSYLKFLWRSKNEHGVHSPFVFDLVTKCFYDKTKYPAYSILNNYRNALLKNKNFIDVTDFGAGSRVFKSNKRQVARIAKTAGISKRSAALLFKVVRYFQPDTILEIGTSLGLATSAMYLGNKNAKIITLEGCPQTINQCQSQLQKFDINNVECVNSKFEDYFKTLDLKPTTFNFIYFDGNHSKTATLAYFEMLLPTINNESVWVFDDIHWSPEMELTWEIIKEHPKVTVTIDTFQWGMVFFRNEQVKEHFVIRI